MLRREVLKSIAVTGALSAGGAATAATGRRRQDPSLTVGSLDLSRIEAIDVHIHMSSGLSDAAANERWNADFVEALLPPPGMPGRDVLRERLLVQFRQHVTRMPREIGMRNFVARTYGVEPTPDACDATVTSQMRKGYATYYREVMNRENIAGVLLQAAGTEPVRPKALIPDDRMEWTFNISPLLQPNWALEQGVDSISTFESKLHDVMQRAKDNGARGIKIAIAYYRPIAIQQVSKQQAERDLKRVLGAPSAVVGVTRMGYPAFDDPEVTRALLSYQDYLLKSLYVRAGQLDLRIIIHSAVALHPALRSDYNDPTGLYSLFQDTQVKLAGTQFVLIHTGYPHHHQVASFLSQFPYVFADLSFYASYPGTLEETLRAFLGLAPSEKIMHGGDWSTPESIGYSADNTRRVLAKVLGDYRNHYGWTASDCETAARNILCENARRIYALQF